MKLKNAVWLTADRKKAVPAGHEDAAFLLAGPGATVTKDQAKQYGLTENGAEGQKATKGVAEPFKHGVTPSTPDGVNTAEDAPQAKGIAFQMAEEKAKARAGSEPASAPVKDEAPTKSTKRG